MERVITPGLIDAKGLLDLQLYASPGECTIMCGLAVLGEEAIRFLQQAREVGIWNTEAFVNDAP